MNVLTNYNPLGNLGLAPQLAFQQRPESLFQSGQLRLPGPE
jgi:hypothetical protein